MKAFKNSNTFGSDQGSGGGSGGGGSQGPGYGGGSSNSGFQSHQNNQGDIIKVIRVVTISNPAREVSSSSNPDFKVIPSS